MVVSAPSSRVTIPLTQSSGQVKTCPVKSPVIVGIAVVGATASIPEGPAPVQPVGLPVDESVTL